MSGFDPGPGWRVVREPADTDDGDEVRYRSSDDSAVRYWVREVPVPPLPTVPYTVIRVTWKDGQPTKEYTLIGGRWGVMRPDELAEQMAGFEVLSEPRAVTAKATIDRVRQIVGVPFGAKGWPEVVAHEFGVES